MTTTTIAFFTSKSYCHRCPHAASLATCVTTPAGLPLMLLLLVLTRQLPDSSELDDPPKIWVSTTLTLSFLNKDSYLEAFSTSCSPRWTTSLHQHLLSYLIKQHLTKPFQTTLAHHSYTWVTCSVFENHVCFKYRRKKITILYVYSPSSKGLWFLLSIAGLVTLAELEILLLHYWAQGLRVPPHPLSVGEGSNPGLCDRLASLYHLSYNPSP